MLQKLAKQTAIYGISTIVGRFLSYMLTPYYTRIFGTESYGVVSYVYAFIPLALTLLTMGMESSYFKFAAKAEERGGDVEGAKRKLFATTWQATTFAALIFTLVLTLFRGDISSLMGRAYAENPEYVAIVAFIILFDVASALPFARLREQNKAGLYVVYKMANIVLQVALAFGFGFLGLFDGEFGVGWVFVANLIASAITFAMLMRVASDRRLPRLDWGLLRSILVYSIPLLMGGIAGTAAAFIDRVMIGSLLPDSVALSQVGLYNAITKIAVVMMLFTQMYRLAAEPFFLASYPKDDFKAMNAAALKYYIIASMVIFLGISLFRDLFALIVGRDFREGISILPLVLGAYVLNGVWLNLSFWYKREERTGLAIVITGVGLLTTLVFCLVMIPRWGYGGAAWARLGSEAAMVVVSLMLNVWLYPTRYEWGRIVEYVAVAMCGFFASEYVAQHLAQSAIVGYGVNFAILLGYIIYVVWREKIDLRGLLGAMIKRKK